jgi:FtsP/CotA-like multicopper oxidase with cupredoxin domain
MVRAFRTLAAVALLTVSLLACGDDDGGDGASPSSPPASLDGAATGEPLAAPEVIAGEDGPGGRELVATLEVAKAPTEIAGVEMTALTYNGSFQPPLLEMTPGDHVEITIVNGLDEATNLHTHGLHVSPITPGDNVLMTIPAGESFTYEYDLPDDHAPGTYWYHSHAHGISEGQVFAGMSGVIVIRGLDELLPADLRDVTQHVFALKDIQIEDGAIITDNIDSNASTTRLVNGQLQPVVTMRPGETQLWRLANVGADIFYRVGLSGAELHVIAEDGNPVAEVRSFEDLVMPPGKRFDVLVQAADSGSMNLETLGYDQGGDTYPEVTLATVAIDGDPAPELSLPTSLAPFEDLREVEAAESRSFAFTEDDANNQFFINGEMFSHDRVNTVVQLDTVEEWTISNDTTEQHPFHIHVNDFQVVSVNGEAYDAVSLQDTVILPSGGDVVIRMHFTDFLGKYVYHCHILNHEDNGMMAVLEVVAAA